MASPTYTEILSSEVDSDSPLTASLAFRWTFNPLSIMQGSPTARAAGLGVFIAKAPSGGGATQTGILTDAVDPSFVLSPDGLGSVQWTARTYFTAYNASLSNNSLGVSQNASFDTESGSGWAPGSPYSTPEVIGSRKIIQNTNASRIILRATITKVFVVTQGEDTAALTFIVRLYKKRASTYTLVQEKTIQVNLPQISNTETSHSVSTTFDNVVINATTNDSYHIECSYYCQELYTVPPESASDLLTFFSIN